MQKSVEFRGKTTEDALSNGLQQLGLERDDVSVEIIERGKKGVFGIGASDAVVRITYEVPDPVPEKETANPVAPKSEKAAAPVKPQTSVEKTTPKKAPEAKPVKTEKPPKQGKPAPAAEQNKDQVRSQKASPASEGEQAERTEAFLTGLMQHMGVKAEMTISQREGGGLNVQLTGEDVGAVIGRRGETLDAIQHLTNYAVNRGSERKGHISVDAENYRAKREESLVKLAEKMAAKAVKYKRSMALEPMNSYERHVIHTALQNYEGVTTSSIGTEPNRRVVVSYVHSEPAKKESGDYKEWC